MPYNDIVLRKESFGGIVGRRDGYGFHAINEAGFSLLERSADDLSAISFGGGSHAFANRLSSLGFLRGNAFIGEVIRNHNVVPYMSAPIRVWLEVTSRCNLIMEWLPPFAGAWKEELITHWKV